MISVVRPSHQYPIVNRLVNMGKLNPGNGYMLKMDGRGQFHQITLTLVNGDSMDRRDQRDRPKEKIWKERRRGNKTMGKH